MTVFTEETVELAALEWPGGARMPKARWSMFRPDTGVSSQPVPFEVPLDDEALADIRWYLERFAIWPRPEERERAKQIESHFEEWGRALRDSVLSGAEPARLWQQFIDAGGACTERAPGERRPRMILQ